MPQLLVHSMVRNQEDNITILDKSGSTIGFYNEKSV